MRLNFRLIVPLVVVLSLVSFLSSYYQVKTQKRDLQQDLEKRTVVLAESLQESIEPQLAPQMGRNAREELQRLVERFGNREHLFGIGIYGRRGEVIAVTPSLATRLSGFPLAVARPDQDRGRGEFLRFGETPVYIYVLPMHVRENSAASLVVVQDSAFIQAQSLRFWRNTFLRLLVELGLIALTVWLIVRWSISGPIARTVQWMKALRTGKAAPRYALHERDLLMPVAQEAMTFAENLAAARAVAENEARLRETAESTWTPERLAIHVRSKLRGNRLFVVSNREPYSHVKEGKSVKVLIPASGLVTAIEPILCACDGTWVAHGSGDADREAVDHHDRLQVPPDEPKYTLRRIWLGKEEEDGYYYGFANEGLWPLCHIAHTRPLFRASDWQYYREVNQKFADAILEEMAGTEQPVLLVQDYHFALLPQLIKKKRPDARIAIFWHIPWPNPEAFGICPWQCELLDGLLGADLVGFHVQAHCTNFLETVDRALESRIEWERFAVNREGHLTTVRPFPISVSFTELDASATYAQSPPSHGVSSATPLSLRSPSAGEERAALLKELGFEGQLLGVGVDRVDYTKGILERFWAIERFLHKYPRYRGHFTFVQIGAPSRTHIKRYHDFLAEVDAEAERINWRFQTEHWKPIIFRKRHHSHREIERYYRAAHLCLVTSLHDGMNLVAKEFLAARHDEEGVLILSRFTGACRELRDALIVNPYDTEEMADAILYALEMEPGQRRARMQRLRRVVKEQNIYRWAGNLIGDLCEMRPETEGAPRERVKEIA
jgi:trehalose 6-phosphate synthase